jgi:hypothetical protein
MGWEGLRKIKLFSVELEGSISGRSGQKNDELFVLQASHCQLSQEQQLLWTTVYRLFIII